MRVRKRLRNQPNVTASGAPNPIRWQHAEREGVVAGHMGFGSPDWAHATTHFRRPDDVAMPKRESRKVASLAACAAFYEAPRELKAIRMDCVPVTTDFDSGSHAAKVIAVTQSVQARLAQHFKSAVRRKAKAIVALAPFDPLADCPKADTSTLQGVTVPRE